MKKYFYYSPRNFRNEYDIYSVDTKNKDDLILSARFECRNSGNPNVTYKQITRKEAERLTAHNRKLYRSGQSTVHNPSGATVIIPISKTEEFD